MIQLQNLEPRMRTYEIDVALDGGQRVRRGGLDYARPAEGARVSSTLRASVHTVPTSFTLAACGTEGDTSGPLAEDVLRAAAVAAALAARPARLKVIGAAAPAPTASPANEGG